MRFSFSLVFVVLIACSGSGGGSDAGGGGAATNAGGGAATTAGGGAEGDAGDDGPRDITDALFTARAADCADYANRYVAFVQDVQRRLDFDAEVEITVLDDVCILTSNAIPNHDFNATGRFATAVSEVAHEFEIPRAPTPAASVTPVELGEHAVFLNGVKLDQLAAACFGVGGEPLGQERIGCGPDQNDNPWRYDPMSPLNGFGTDEHNAHTQPDGTYHYHGSPLAMFEDDCSAEVVSPVVGFAADGYPIFGPCIDDEGEIRRARSSYRLRTGTRQAVGGFTTPTAVGGVMSNEYNGQFIGDYEYAEGEGDLDECNGMEVDGVYGYYITDSYPWVMGCFRGTPSRDFSSR